MGWGSEGGSGGGVVGGGPVGGALCGGPVRGACEGALQGHASRLHLDTILSLMSLSSFFLSFSFSLSDTHRHTHTHRHAQTHTDTHRHTHTHRHTQTHTCRRTAGPNISWYTNGVVKCGASSI